MPIRLPRRWWAWALQFSPAAAILLAVSYEVAFMPRTGKGIMGLDGASAGVCFALPLCFAAAVFLTKPDPNSAIRTIWIVLLAIAVAAVNTAIAFAGCRLVLQ